MGARLFVQGVAGESRREFIDDDPSPWLVVRIVGGLPAVSCDDNGLMQLDTMTCRSRATAVAECTPRGGIEGWRLLQRFGPGAVPDVDSWPVPDAYKELQRAAMRGERRGKPRMPSAEAQQYIAEKQTKRMIAEVESAIEAARDPTVPPSARPVMPLSKLETVRAMLSGEDHDATGSAGEVGGADRRTGAAHGRGGRRRCAGGGAGAGKRNGAAQRGRRAGSPPGAGADAPEGEEGAGVDGLGRVDSDRE